MSFKNRGQFYLWLPPTASIAGFVSSILDFFSTDVGTHNSVILSEHLLDLILDINYKIYGKHE